jgi:Protein of unknown function DUF45
MKTGAAEMTRQGETSSPTYGIELHKHRFAAWAASRAASVKNCRFSVEDGRELLEECGFNESFSRPEQLPEPRAIDEEHRKWRADIVGAAKSRERPFTHGVAATLANIYLKSRFVCGGHHDHERVQSLHPPIDAVLLEPTHNARFQALMDRFMPGWQFHRELLNRLPIRREDWDY